MFFMALLSMKQKKNAIRKLNCISNCLSMETAKHLEALTYHLSDKTRGLTIQGKFYSQKGNLSRCIAGREKSIYCEYSSKINSKWENLKIL